MRKLRIDLRMAGAAALALITGIGVHLATRPEPTVQVLVATSPLPPGVRLSELDVALRPMPLFPGMVTAGQVADLTAHTLVAALDAGDPVLHSLLVPPQGDHPDVAALTLDPAHAVQGDLVPGDRVDIYSSGNGTTTLLADEVLVIAATRGSGGLEGGDVSLLLAVDRQLALRLLEGAHTTQLDLVRRAR